MSGEKWWKNNVIQLNQSKMADQSKLKHKIYLLYKINLEKTINKFKRLICKYILKLINKKR